MFINGQHGQIIIITGRTVETGAAARPGGLGIRESILKFTQDTG